MYNTRERILNAALHCFAQNGYEAASISDIASQLGISKGALYRHFANKRAILDAIIARMAQQDAERAREYAVPEAEFSVDGEAYRQTDPETIDRFAIAQFHYWTEDPFAADLWSEPEDHYAFFDSMGLGRDRLIPAKADARACAMAAWII